MASGTPSSLFCFIQGLRAAIEGKYPQDTDTLKRSLHEFSLSAKKYPISKNENKKYTAHGGGSISTRQMNKLQFRPGLGQEPVVALQDQKDIAKVGAYLKNIYPGMILRTGLKYFLANKDFEDKWNEPYLLRAFLMKQSVILNLLNEGYDNISVTLTSKEPVVFTTKVNGNITYDGTVLEKIDLRVIDKNNSIDVLYRALNFMDLLQTVFAQERGRAITDKDQQDLITLALECTDAKTPLDGLNDMSDVSNQTNPKELNKALGRFLGGNSGGVVSQLEPGGGGDGKGAQGLGDHHLGRRHGASAPDLSKMTQEQQIRYHEQQIQEINAQKPAKKIVKGPSMGPSLGHGPRSRARRGGRDVPRSPSPCRSTCEGFWCECAAACPRGAPTKAVVGFATPYDSLFELSSSSEDDEEESSSDEEEQEKEAPLPNAYCRCDPCAVVQHGTYFGVGQHPALALAVEVVPFAEDQDPACHDQVLQLVRCSRPEAFGSLPTVEKMVDGGGDGQDQTPAVRAFEARVRRALRKQGVAGILREGCRVALKGGARQWQIDVFCKVVREFLTPSAEHAAACEHVRAVKVHDPKRKRQVVVLLDPRRSQKKLRGALSVHEDLDAALAHLGQQPQTPPAAVMLVADRHDRELSAAAAEESRGRLAALEAAHGGGALSAEDCAQYFANDPVIAENYSRLHSAGKRRAKNKSRGSHYLVALAGSPSDKFMDWTAMGRYAMDQQHDQQLL